MSRPVWTVCFFLLTFFVSAVFLGEASAIAPLETPTSNSSQTHRVLSNSSKHKHQHHHNKLPTKEEKKNLKPGWKHKAFIHIGPTKTGTTHTQAYLLHQRAKLESLNFYAPDYDGGYGVAYQGNMLRELTDPNTTTTQFYDFIQNCTKEKRNIVISSETLSMAPPHAIDNLAEFFKDFNVTIIMGYRDILTRCLSFYRMVMGDLNVLLPEFLQYAAFRYEVMRKQHFNALERFGKSFGLDKMVVVEYQGMMDSPHDEVYVMLCEVMNLMCYETGKLNKGGRVKPKHQNSAPEQIPRQLLNLVETTVMMQGTDCRYFSADERHQYLRIIQSFLEDLYQRYDNKRSVPVETVLLEEFWNSTIEADRSTRYDYKYKAWLYEAEARVDEERKNLAYERLNAFKLHTDTKFWKKWFETLVTLLDIENTCTPK